MRSLGSIGKTNHASRPTGQTLGTPASTSNIAVTKGTPEDSGGLTAPEIHPKTEPARKRNKRAATRYGLLVGRTPEDIGRIRARLDRLSTPEPNTGCILWLGAATPDGYGKFGLGPVNGAPKFVAYAHRVAFELEHGPIPEGHETDHTCRVRGCINALHMQAVTHRENCVRRPAESYWGTRQPRERRAA